MQPRLRLEPTLSRRARLDGAWWPLSTDILAELPGLIIAIDARRGPISHVLLSATGWEGRATIEGQATSVQVAGRSVRLAWETTQPLSLLTGVCENGERVELLVIPPDLPAAAARKAMGLAASASNTKSAPEILTAVATGERPATPATDTTEVDWESEGGAISH